MKTNAQPIPHYAEKVYAGVLGKIIGVYLGRPIEGMRKADIEKTLGLVDRYVHHERGVPLVVSDDDISGTFTFVRALEDSGKGLETKALDFGRAWMNYLVEGKTVLWWGGRGLSTEHTAYLQLKAGVEAPESGSMRRNGQVVAEQIGAQIFIDAIGLVIPGNPDLAAKMAGEAARVSHDGEAVYGAQVVAAMVSAAFTESDMEKLLDTGVSFIPEDSLIAQIHRDVRAWAREDGNWHRTFDRISEKWGYHRYGGNCHILPNHALMVLAWAYAGQDFRLAQAIVNTCGWDTDCNAANVGSVMGVSLGLSAMTQPYDFQAPFADRIVLPTAEGTHATTDALLLSDRLAALGRKLMGWEAPPQPKPGAWHHFTMPGSLHGWMAEDLDDKRPGLCALSNPGGKLLVQTPPLHEGRKECVSTPVVAAPGGGGYAVMGCPKLYPGQRIRLHATASGVQGAPGAKLFLRHYQNASKLFDGYFPGQEIPLIEGKAFDLEITVPDLGGAPVSALGLEFCGKEGTLATLAIDRICVDGKWSFRLEEPLARDSQAPGWIHAMGRIASGFSDDKEKLTRVVQDQGRGILATGTTEWTDYRVSMRLTLHLPGKGGLVARYQGLDRYLSLEGDGKTLELVEILQGTRKVLGTIEAPWAWDELHHLELVCQDEHVKASVDGRMFLEAKTALLRGGAGVLAQECNVGFREFSAEAI
jgi:ADP-ribosylglycohydrolase